MPGPRKDEREVRFALSNEALKITSIPVCFLMVTSSDATSSSNSCDSMTQGPAINTGLIFSFIVERKFLQG